MHKPTIALPLILAALASSAAAQTVSVVVTDKPGTYVLVIKADGSATHSPSQQSKRTGQTEPIPEPEPGDRAALFETAVKSIDQDAEEKKQDGLVVATSWQEIGNQCRGSDASITSVPQLEDVLIRAERQVFRRVDDQWDSVRKLRIDEHIKLRQGNASLEEFAKLLDDASAGVAKGAGADLAAVDVEAIVEFIQAIIAGETAKAMAELLRFILSLVAG